MDVDKTVYVKVCLRFSKGGFQLSKNRWMLILSSFLITTLFLNFSSDHIKAESVPQIILPHGYRIEPYITELTFPTGITWDESGLMYVAEASTNDAKEFCGIVSQAGPNVRKVVVEDLNWPVTDIKMKNDILYVAHKGTLSAIEGIVQNSQQQTVSATHLIEDLPFGDYTTGEIAFGQDQWIYLGNGTVTNSGVVGSDNLTRSWAKKLPENHDIPAKDVVLAGNNFDSRDPRTVNPFDTIQTGAFLPFGIKSERGQIIFKETRASGVVYRVKQDGSSLELFAWGLRNPCGIGFTPDSRLIAVDQGCQERGVRPIANAEDSIYHIIEDGWYGWPDFVAGQPITDTRFISRTKQVPNTFLLQEHPSVEQPMVCFDPGTGLMKFDFAPASFDIAKRMYIASFGGHDISSLQTGINGFFRKATLGKPKTDSAQTSGSILVIDLDTKEHEVFAHNKPSSSAGGNFFGLNHPVDVKFGPDGSMYVIDFGVIERHGVLCQGIPGTGVVWKITIQRSELKIFREQCIALVQKLFAQNYKNSRVWDPNYAEIQAKVEQLIDEHSQLGQEWGLFFKDLSSGKTFGINEELQIPAASTVKVPVVHYISKLVSEGKISWNEELTYQSARDWRGGAGIIQYTAKDGDTFTIRELAEKTITHSDNIAWKMLERRVGKENLINFMKEIGGSNVYPEGQNVSTPKDNAMYMEAALNFSKVDPEGEKLMFDLAHTIWNTGLNRYITEVTVAHKEGDIMGVADDVGVVFAQHPYILSIMSKGHSDVEEGFEKIGKISKMIFDYQNMVSSLVYNE